MIDGGIGLVAGPINDGLVEPLPPPQRLHEPAPVGGSIRAPVKTREVAPVYPPIAPTARVQGIVIIYVAGDGAQRYGEIVAVIDAGKGAGVDRVGMVTAGMRRAARP